MDSLVHAINTPSHATPTPSKTASATPNSSAAGATGDEDDEKHLDDATLSDDLIYDYEPLSDLSANFVKLGQYSSDSASPTTHSAPKLIAVDVRIFATNSSDDANDSNDGNNESSDGSGDTRGELVEVVLHNGSTGPNGVLEYLSATYTNSASADNSKAPDGATEPPDELESPRDERSEPYEDSFSYSDDGTSDNVIEWDSLNSLYGKKRADLRHAVSNLEHIRNSFLLVTRGSDASNGAVASNGSGEGSQGIKEIILINASKYGNGVYNVYDFEEDAWLFECDHKCELFASMNALPGGQALFVSDTILIISFKLKVFVVDLTHLRSPRLVREYKLALNGVNTVRKFYFNHSVVLLNASLVAADAENNNSHANSIAKHGNIADLSNVAQIENVNENDDMNGSKSNSTGREEYHISFVVFGGCFQQNFNHSFVRINLVLARRDEAGRSVARRRRSRRNSRNGILRKIDKIDEKNEKKGANGANGANAMNAIDGIENDLDLFATEWNTVSMKQSNFKIYNYDRKSRNNSVGSVGSSSVSTPESGSYSLASAGHSRSISGTSSASSSLGSGLNNVAAAAAMSHEYIKCFEKFASGWAWNAANEKILFMIGGNSQMPMQSKSVLVINLSRKYIVRYLKNILPFECQHDPLIMCIGNLCHVKIDNQFCSIKLDNLIDKYVGYGINEPIAWKNERLVWIGYLKNDKNEKCFLRQNYASREIIQNILQFLKYF